MLKKELALNVGDAEPILAKLISQPTPPDVAACLPQFDPYHCEYVKSFPVRFLNAVQQADGSISYDWTVQYFDLFLN